MDWVTVGAYAFVGCILLVALWPTVSSGQRFLRRWGVREPSAEQTELAVRYLRDRRLLYPPLFLLTPLVLPSGWGPDIFVALIAALLVAEAIGAIKPVRGPRAARLTPRKWSDLVQRWAVGAMVALGLLAIGLAVAGLSAQPWAENVIWSTNLPEQTRSELGEPVGVLVILMVALGLAEVLGIVAFAVNRAPVQDQQVDAVLRTRSARVGVGIGFAWMASAVLLANSRITFLTQLKVPQPAPPWLESLSFGGLFGFVTLFVGLAGWYWVANPGSRMPYAQSTT